MPRLFILFLFLAAASAHALEIRNYSPTRHDRFVAGTSGQIINPNAYYNSSLYTGVGFGTPANDARQFPLVTPEHVLFARHFAFGGNIRFINAGGTAIDRTILLNTEVPNGSGGTSDLIIMKLSAPVTATDHGISPFPYLNLATESAYTNTVLTTFGQTTRAGRGRIASFGNYIDSGIEQTRIFRFNYSTFTGNADDAYVVGGDSGSPTFAIANNRPALVGVHLAVSSGFGTITNIDTFVPNYAATVNGLLAAEGYQLIPAYPASVTMSTTLASVSLRQSKPATLSIDLANTSANTATNPRLRLVFPDNAIPDSVSASGWIIENPAPRDYRLRRATLSGNSTSTASITYNAVPVIEEIAFEVVQRSDGSPEASQTFTLPVMETFAGFVSALPLKGELDDPDSDSFPNLIEYALGGDPGISSATTAGGIPLAPQVAISGNTLSYSFPRRTDAAARGLTYEIRFSETLEENSFSSSPPPGFSMAAAPYSPDVPGFEQVTASLPATSPEKLFLRLEVTLAE